MERKTHITANEGQQDLVITREFDLPLDLLFTAYSEAELVEQWMGTTVLQLDNQKFGGWQFETKDPKGNVVFRANGVTHDFLPNQRIIRTFEMENSPFPVQLEFLEFEKIDANTSKLTMQIVYRSVEDRDKMLKLPFKQGINIAHNRLQDVLNKSKTQFSNHG